MSINISSPPGTIKKPNPAFLTDKTPTFKLGQFLNKINLCFLVLYNKFSFTKASKALLSLLKSSGVVNSNKSLISIASNAS